MVVAATEQAVENRIAFAVQSACEEHAPKLKASLEAVARQILASVASSEITRAKQYNDAVIALETSLREGFRTQVVQMEAQLEKRFRSLETSERRPRNLAQLTQDVDRRESGAKFQADLVRRLEVKRSGLAEQLGQDQSNHEASPPSRELIL